MQLKQSEGHFEPKKRGKSQKAFQIKDEISSLGLCHDWLDASERLIGCLEDCVTKVPAC